LAGHRSEDAWNLTNQSLASIGKDARVLYSLGLQFAGAQEYEHAAELLQRTDAIRPGTPEVLYNLGVTFYNLNRLDEASQKLQSAAALRPDDPDPLYRLGLIASAQRNSAFAIGYWQQAIKCRE